MRARPPPFQAPTLWSAALACVRGVVPTEGATMKEQFTRETIPSPVTLTILYNNVPHDPRTSKGLVIVTGCRHPGIVNIVERAKTICEDEVHLVLGGFHLMGRARNDIQDIVTPLKQLGVRKVGPSHCTGEQAMSMFRAAWGDQFIDLGCGATLVVDPVSNDAP